MPPWRVRRRHVMGRNGGQHLSVRVRAGSCVSRALERMKGPLLQRDGDQFGGGPFGVPQPARRAEAAQRDEDRCVRAKGWGADSRVVLSVSSGASDARPGPGGGRLQGHVPRHRGVGRRIVPGSPIPRAGRPDRNQRRPRRHSQGPGLPMPTTSGVGTGPEPARAAPTQRRSAARQRPALGTSAAV